MAYYNFVSDNQREFAGGHVQRAVVLNVSLSTDPNKINVCPSNSVKPNVAVIAYLYVTQQDHSRRKKYVFSQSSLNPSVFYDHFNLLPVGRGLIV
jgi:hypothetical protein